MLIHMMRCQTVLFFSGMERKTHQRSSDSIIIFAYVDFDVMWGEKFKLIFGMIMDAISRRRRLNGVSGTHHHADAM